MALDGAKIGQKYLITTIITASNKFICQRGNSRTKDGNNMV